jgi:predicted acetyltransferase
MSVEIRTIPADQLRTWLDAVNVAFGEHTSEDQWALDQRVLEPARVLGAYDGETLVGGAAAFSLQLTVPGARLVPTAGVTAVGVLPTHRRQGILRQLMARQLADIRQAGEPLAVLWASEGSIYQRFGYGLGTLTSAIDVERVRAAFRAPIPPQGSMRMVSRDEARRLLPGPFDAVRQATPGFFARGDAWWDVFLADPQQHRGGAGEKFFAVHERDGRPVGYVIYRIKQEWGDPGSANELIVLELIGVDALACQQLWRYVFGVDLVARVSARRGPAGHPLLLLLAEPRRARLRIGDGLWLRIVDVPAALAARAYEHDGSLVLEVTDEFLPDAAGRWRLTVGDGQATVEPTDSRADLRLDVADLGAVYLGAFDFAELARAGRTHELSPGAWARADDIFATPLRPWCPEIF